MGKKSLIAASCLTAVFIIAVPTALLWLRYTVAMISGAAMFCMRTHASSLSSLLIILLSGTPSIIMVLLAGRLVDPKRILSILEDI